jgi:UDP-N-acetyl-2-amino-2-deoxyglucuronate dehydrogenase
MKVRFGVIGIGGAGKDHCRLLLQNPDAELTAVADTDKTSVDETARELGVRGYTDYRDLLHAGIVDAIAIATPHNLHFPMVMDSLNARLHVLSEKPVATRVSEAEMMIKAAKDRKLKYSVCHQYRIHRSARKLKEIVDSGDIGTIMRVLWTWWIYRPDSYYDRYPWKGAFSAAGGGVLGYFGIHELDLICWIIGKPVQVTAMIGNQLHSIGTEDIVCASILFANGAMGSLQLTLNQPQGYSTRQIAGDRGIVVMPDVKSLTYDMDDEIRLGTYQDSLSVLSSKQKEIFDQPDISWQHITLSNEAHEENDRITPAGNSSFINKMSVPRRVLRRLGLLKAGEKINIPPEPRLLEPREVVVNSFVNAVVNDEEPVITAESTLPALEFMNALMLSAIRGKTVTLPIDRDEYDHLFNELLSCTSSVPRYRP